MKSSVATKKRQNVNQLTIGIDLGDRWGHYCMLDEHGEVLEKGRVPMTRKALTAHFSDVPARIEVALHPQIPQPSSVRAASQRSATRPRSITAKAQPQPDRSPKPVRL